MSYFHWHRWLPCITCSWPVGVYILEYFSHQGHLYFVITITIIIKAESGKWIQYEKHPFIAGLTSWDQLHALGSRGQQSWVETSHRESSDLFCHHIYCIHSVLIWVFHRYLLSKARSNGASPVFLKGTQLQREKEKQKGPMLTQKWGAFDLWEEGWLFLQWNPTC